MAVRLSSRRSACTLGDDLRSLLDAENVRVDDEVVVRREVGLDAVETSQVVASGGIGVLDRLPGGLGIEPLGFRQPPHPSLGRCGQENAEYVGPAGERKRRSMGDDDDVATVRSLLDRVPNQVSNRFRRDFLVRMDMAAMP